MENGEWRTENGERRMEKGEWRMENGNSEYSFISYNSVLRLIINNSHRQSYLVFINERLLRATRIRLQGRSSRN